MRKLIVPISLLFLTVFTTSCSQDPSETSIDVARNTQPANNIKSENSQSNQSSVFKPSERESAAQGKWKGRSLEELFDDALKGDSAAMYMMGLCHLYGHEMTINIERANIFFAASASLGYAPAIDKIRAMYVEDITNPFLSLVYANLVTSFGHPEYALPYHVLREDLVKEGGSRIVKEVERIALDKMTQIVELQQKLKESKDKSKLIAEMITTNGIIGEDIVYGLDYWEKFFDKKP